MTRALIIEDDACSALALETLLRRAGMEPTTIADTDAALRAVKQNPPDILIADWNVVGSVSSLTVAQRLRELRSDARVLFVSGFEREEIEELVSEFSPCSIYTKPINFDVMLLDLEAESPEAPGGQAPTERAASL